MRTKPGTFEKFFSRDNNRLFSPPRQVSSDDSGLGEVQENSDKTDDSGTKGTKENLDKNEYIFYHFSDA